MESSCLNVSVDAAVKAAEMALAECELATDPFEAEALAWIAEQCAAGVEAGATHAWTTAMHALEGLSSACGRAWQAAGCRESCYNPPKKAAERALSEGAFDLASRARERAKYCLGNESLVGPRPQEYSAALAQLADARATAANSEDLGELNAARATIEKRILDAVLQADDVPAANHKPEGHGPCAV